LRYPGDGLCVGNFQPAFDALYSFDELVNADLLARIRLVTAGHFAFDGHHGMFKAGHTMLQIAHVVGNLVNSPANVP